MRIISSNRVHLETALALGAQEHTWTPWQSRALAVLAAPSPHTTSLNGLRSVETTAARPLPYAPPDHISPRSPPPRANLGPWTLGPP